MAKAVTIYGIKNCDTMKKARAWLDQVRKLAERGAGSVEQRLPPRLPRPALEHAALDAGALVVVEGIGDAALVEPGAWCRSS